MFNTTSKTFAPKVPGTIDLEISDPVLLLNEIAKRYETTERVLMEYVDNALDDAELLYRENSGRYPYPIRIDITIDRTQRAITVKDNCQGMTRETLERIVRNIGESRKRGQTWVNGRFGFGVHAFRAAADSISFETKHFLGSHYSLILHRDQHRGIKEARRLDEPFPTESGTGCIVSLQGVDHDWFHTVSVASIRSEVEKHFERLVARPNLHVTVCEAEVASEVCRPFEYDDFMGTELRRAFEIDYQDTHYQGEVVCKITELPADRPVSFFARGRRIGNVADNSSFMRKSVYKKSVWNHPRLIGYVEVGDIVQPVINRDEFVRTRSRTLLYEALLPIEAELRELLVGSYQHVRSDMLTQYEQDVQTALREAGYDISDLLVGFDTAPGDGPRATLADGRLLINTSHPDFQVRLGSLHQGKLRASDRLNSYLAAVLAIYSGQAASPGTHTAEDDSTLSAQVGLMVDLEARLRQLQRGSR